MLAPSVVRTNGKLFPGRVDTTLTTFSLVEHI